MKNIFVTGTDTDIGKTIVSAILCKKLNLPYWKPVQSGNTEMTDADNVNKLTGVEATTSILLNEPLSPHLSAQIDGVSIRIKNLHSPFSKRHLIEGAGGLFVPLNDDEMIIDLIASLACEVVLVARSGLGTINHTCLSIKALKDRGIPILGVVMVGDKNEHNKNAIEHYGEVKVIGEIPILAQLTPQSIEKAGDYITL